MQETKSSKSKLGNSEVIISTILICISFFTLWAFLLTPILDGDLWFHLLYGRWIIENHSIITDHTIYSWTPSSNQMIYCAWISQILFYLIYSLSGYTGIIVFRYLMVTSLFIAIAYLAIQRRTVLHPLTWFAAIISILAIGPATLDKPEFISLALMTAIVLVYFLAKQHQSKQIFFFYCFPLILLAWVNAHGAFIFGCIFLLIVGIGETLNYFLFPQNSLPKKPYLHLIISLFLALLTIFLTPYGYTYILQLVFSFLDMQMANHYEFVMAYMKTFDLDNPRTPFFAYSAVGTLFLVLMYSLRKKQLDLVPLLSNIVFAFLFTRYLRSMYFWAPIFTLTVAFYAGNVSFSKPVIRKLFMASIASASLVMSTWILYQENCFPTRERWPDLGLCEFATLDEEIDYIQQNYPHSRLGNMYDHGAYILWKLWPQTRVMIDARYFPYKEWFSDYAEFETGQNIAAFIEKYPFEIIEIKHNAIALLRWFNNSDKWKLVFYGKNAAIFALKTANDSISFIRGHSLSDISAYGTALNVFNTSLEIRDWDGADIILATMKRNFHCDHQVKRITGLEWNKSATQAYWSGDYDKTISHMEQAIAHKVIDQDIYTAAYQRKSVFEWKKGNQTEAIKLAFKAQQISNSIATHYNLAVMGWSISLQDTNSLKIPVMADQEKNALSNWQTVLANLIENRKQLPQNFSQFLDNAEKILSNSKDAKILFMEPEF